MKKQVVLFSLITIPIILGISGCVTMATKEQMTHEYINSYSGFSKDVLFDKILKWVAQNFRSTTTVVEYQDKASGAIVAKGIIPNVVCTPVIVSVTGDLHFTATIDVRDGKARITYSNIDLYVASGTDVNHITESQCVHERATNEFNSFNDRLTKAINDKDEF